MANITFAGVVSAQAAAGETVTITVTKPDSTKDTLTATTDGNGNYSVTKTYTVSGSYSAIATVTADAQYAAATSPATPFTISLVNRTVALNVALS